MEISFYDVIIKKYSGDGMKKVIWWLWILLNSIFGIALGALLIGGYFGVNVLLPVILAAVVFGGVHFLIWFLMYKNRKQKKWQFYRKFLLVTQLVVFILIGSVCLVQRYEFTNQPQFNQNRIQTFRHLWKAIGQSYPYFEEKNIDWDNVYQEFEPRVSLAETDEEFNIVIAEMMANLKDAHSQLQSPQYDQPVYATVKSIGGIPVLDMVGRSAQAAGISEGLVLLSVEGVPVENAIKMIHLAVNNAATEQAQRIRKMENLLALPKDEKPLTITVLNQDGRSQEIVIKKLPPIAGDTTSDFPTEPPVVTWEKMENNIGLIHVSRLWNRQGEDLIDQFDTALGALMDTQGLVLDLRGNGGGNSIFADQIAGRFITEPFVYGYEEYPVRLYTRGFRKTTSYQVQPRGEIYQGELVVLTDEYVMSSAEWLVGALKDSDRAITVGRTTSGSTGNPIRFYLPGGGWVRYSTAAFYRPNGTLVEGIGYVPDITINWTVEEYLSGNDPDLQAALQSMK